MLCVMKARNNTLPAACQLPLPARPVPARPNALSPAAALETGKRQGAALELRVTFAGERKYLPVVELPPSPFLPSSTVLSITRRTGPRNLLALHRA